MIQTKQLYLSPTAETLVVQVEETILQTSQLGASGFSEQGNVKDSDNTGWGW